VSGDAECRDMHSHAGFDNEVVVEYTLVTCQTS